MLQQPSASAQAVHHPAVQSTSDPRCFAHFILQLPASGASGSVHVAHAGREVVSVAMRDRYGATIAAAYSDLESTLVCAPASCALFVVYELCLPAVRSSSTKH